jgi:hypothetical protein
VEWAVPAVALVLLVAVLRPRVALAFTAMAQLALLERVETVVRVSLVVQAALEHPVSLAEVAVVALAEVRVPTVVRPVRTRLAWAAVVVVVVAREVL